VGFENLRPWSAWGCPSVPQLGCATQLLERSCASSGEPQFDPSRGGAGRVADCGKCDAIGGLPRRPIASEGRLETVPAVRARVEIVTYGKMTATAHSCDAPRQLIGRSSPLALLIPSTRSRSSSVCRSTILSMSPEMKILIASLRRMVAEGRLRELDLLTPVEELERAITATLAKLPA
jgi:hypothetical protein